MNEDSDKYANFSHEELVAEIKRLKKNKKYGLVWEHKKEQVIEDFETQQPYLQEVTEKRIENAPGEPTNLIIEGDNFEALSILNYTHAGKVDVIYIDPPYNTGNKDFIYNDNYVDSEDEFRHSKWLSFMEPRLKLAKNLLKDDGVIFISIDDNEQAALKMLCDGVFGENNFITKFVWEKTQHFGRQKKNYYSNCEYVFCYGKNMWSSDGLREVLVEYIKTDFQDAPLYNASNPENDLVFPAGSVKFNIPDGVYSEAGDSKTQLLSPVTVKDGRNVEGFSLRMKSRWSPGKIIEEYKKGTTYWVKSKSFSIRTIYADGKEFLESPRQLIFTNNKNELVAHNRFGRKVGTNEEASAELVSLKIDGFDYSKPASLIDYLLSLSRRTDAVILDFFAGSGTTGQAVLELNKEDGGHRQFILCTNNGDKGPDSAKIAEDITYPRIKTVITGKRQDGSKYSDGIPANLRYYKIEHKEKKASIDANRLEIVRYLEDIIQVKENAFEQIEVNEDLALYKNSERFVGMVFEPFALEEIIESIKEKNSENKPVKLYVFSYSRDAFEDNFGTDFEIEFVAMPEGLLKTYANIVAETKKEDA